MLTIKVIVMDNNEEVIKTSQLFTQKLLKCKLCSKSCKSLKSLKTHEQSHESQNKNKISCKVCGQQFKYQKLLQRHEIMHDGSSYWCRICVKPFTTLEEKEQHRTIEHAGRGKRKRCRICPNTSFKTEDEFLWHIKNEHEGKLIDYYMCSDCGKQFKTKSELTHHINSKCGTIKQYKCQVCHQELMTSGSLHNHMLRHNGERSYMCRYCAKLFLTAGQLKVHERIHTQEKAFICNICGKGFCHRQSLITHSTLHTGIKPYQCENCGNSFSCVGNLIKHRRTRADTCGLVPLTTHRVKHPSTKMKVKINTPANSRLKAQKREKELQDKLAALKPQDITNSTDDTDLSDNIIDQKIITNKEAEDLKLDLKLVPKLHPTSINTVNEVNGKDDCYSTIDIKETYIEDLYKTEIKHLSFDDVHIIAAEATPLNKTTKNDFDDDFLNDGFKKNNEYSGILCLNKAESTSNLLDYENDDCNENISEDSNDVQEKLYVTNTTDNQKSKKNGGFMKTQRPHRKRRKVSISEAEVKKFIKERRIEENQETPCKYCNKTYSNVRWLLKHEREHAEMNQYDNNEKPKKLPYKCSCCKIGFETKTECKEHQQKIHADLLTCQDCDKIFANTDSLRSHQNIFHKGVPRKIYSYICEKCGKQFKQKAFLIYHEENNCGTGPMFQCEICLKNFSSVHTRRSHMRVHNPEKKLLCKFCGKSFHWKGQLKIHERSHTGEKPFTCLYCPKAFAYRESLITHSSIHTGIKPHLCEACGSRFSCIGNLLKHRTTHATTCGAWYMKNRS